MRKLIQNKKFLNIVALVAICLLVPQITHAGIAEVAQSIIGWVVQQVVGLLGKLAVQLVYLLVAIASYNEFVNSPTVAEGWAVVRDVVNMFFIVILLVIAFATIFNVSEYKYQKMLPRLLIMAVVINFSRTICGIFIDLGQVVMLTFVNGFQAAAGGNFVNALKITDLMNFDQKQLDAVPGGLQYAQIFAAMLLALIVMIVTVVVLVVMVLVLVMRIIMLWFLIILSPMAFMASVWPGGRIKQKYGQWWDIFLDNIMVGPILAFFLWLSLLVLGTGDYGTTIIKNYTDTGGGQAESERMPNTSLTKIGTPENMLSYIMGIGMLLGSLYMASQMRSAGSGIAGSALGKVKGYASGAVRKAGAVPARIGSYATKEASEVVRGGARRASMPILSSLVRAPLVGGLAAKGVARFRKQEKVRYEKVTSHIQNLNTKEKANRMKRLQSFGGLITDSQKKELTALQRDRLGELQRESFEPTKNTSGNIVDKKTGLSKQDWHKENSKEFSSLSEALKKSTDIDPKIGEKLDKIKEARPDLMDEKGKAETARNLNLENIGKIKEQAWGDAEFIEAVEKANPKLIESLEEKGTGAQKKGIGEWHKWKADKVGGEVAEVEDFRQRIKNKNRPDYMEDKDIATMPSGDQSAAMLDTLAKEGRIEPLIKSGNINVATADLKTSGGIIAKQVAINGSEALRNKFKEEKRDDYVTGLRDSMSIPGDHTDQRAELLRLGENISTLYKIDKKGQFETNDEENKFKADIKKVPKRDVIEISPSLKGEARHQAFETLDRADLASYLNRAQTEGSEEAMAKAKQMIGDYMEVAESGGASENMQKNAKQISALPVFRSFLKKEPTSAEAGAKEYSGGAREVELPEEEIKT